MKNTQQPGQIGGAVEDAPHPRGPHRGKTPAHDSRHQDEQDEVRRDGTHTQVQGAVVPQEGDHGVRGGRAPGHYLGQDVNHQEGHGAERDRAVHCLGDDPAARGHDDAVGREQADAHRRGEPDKCEDPTVKQQKVRDCHVDAMAGRGYSGDD
jgi:hypothetical protein